MYFYRETSLVGVRTAYGGAPRRMDAVAGSFLLAHRRAPERRARACSELGRLRGPLSNSVPPELRQ